MTRRATTTFVAAALVVSAVAGAMGPGVVQAASGTQSDFGVTNLDGRDLNISFHSTQQLTDFDVIVYRGDSSEAVLDQSSFTETAVSGGYRYEYTYTAAADGRYRAELVGESVQDDAFVDTAAPAVTNVQVIDDTDADGVVASGDTVRVRADVTDATTQVDAVKVNASSYGAGNVTLSRTSGSTYEATFAVGGVPEDGPQHVTVVASDNQSNTNFTDAPTLRLDTTAPAYAATTLTDAGGDGTVDAGESVTVEVDVADATTEVQSVTADLSAFGAGATEPLTNASGSSVYNATITVSEGGTTDGDYPVTVDSRDAAGNLNQATAGTLTLNTDPNVTAFAADNSSGQSVGLSFDSDESLGAITVTVSGAASATVTETDFSETGGGPYTYDATYDAPADGTYTFALTEANDSTDKNGADGSSETVVVDTAGPNVGSPTLTDGDGDGNVTAGDSVTVEATVTDATTGVASVTADLSAFDRGESVALSTSDGTTWNATTTVGTAPTEGDQLVAVTATDDEGNSQSANTGTLAVDIGGPAIESPTLRNGSGGVSVVRDGDTVVVSATVTDATGIASVTTDASAFGVGTETLANVGGDAYEASFAVNGSRAAGDGNYSLTVEATDELANANQATTNELTQDVNPPMLSGESLAGADGDGVVADGETVTVELTVTDATTVDSVTANATALGAGASETLSRVGGSDVYDGTFAVDAAGVSDGAHAVTVEAVDSQGKTNETTVGTLTLDTVAPTVAGAALTDGDGDGYLADGETVTVSVTPDGTGSAVRGVDADLSDFGAGTVSLTDGDSDGTWDASASVDAASASADGAYAASLTVTDEAGETNASATGTLTLDTRAPNRTSLSVSDDADGDGVVGDGQSLTVSLSATDGLSGVSSVTADLSDFGAGTVSLADGGGGDWSKTVTVDAASAGPDGDYAVTVDVTDRAGNVESGSSAALTLDTTGPSVSGATLTDETGDGVLTDGENVTVEATATDANGVATVEANLSALGAGTVTLTDRGGGVWNATVAVDASNAAADGSVSTTVNATDDRGATGAATTGTLTLDTAGPSLSGVTFADATDGDGAVAPGDQIDVAATVADPAGVDSVTVDGSAFGAGTNVSLADGDSDGTYTATLTVDFDADAADGDRSVPVTARDAVANERTVQTGTLTLDTPPTVSNFSVTVASDSSLDISFDASETLADANVSLSGATNATLDETDFAVTGTTYETSQTVGANGSVTVTLERLADANGNDGASGQSATVSVNATSDGGGGGGGFRRVVVVGSDSDDEEAANESAPAEANVSVEQSADAVSVRVESAAQSSLVDLPVNASSETASVRLDTLSIAARNESYSVDVTVHDDAPADDPAANATPPGDRPVGYLSVGHTVSDRDIDYAVFRFGVSGERLAERNVSPEEVALYRFHDGAWTELNAILVDERDGTYVYNADTPGLSTFAVARESGGRVAVTGAGVERSRVYADEAVTVTARVANDGTRAATGYVSLRVGNATLESRRVTLGAGDRESETFAVEFAEAGTYDVRVGNLTAGTVSVVTRTPTATATPTPTATPTAAPTATRTAPETGTETGTGIPGFGPVAAVLSLLAAVGLARRRA